MEPSSKGTTHFAYCACCDGAAEALLYTGGGYTPQDYLPETMTVSVPKLRVVLELEADMKCSPLVLLRAAAEAQVKDWSSQLHLRGELQLQASYMNGALDAWEPLIEPIVEGENVFRPWELQVGEEADSGVARLERRSHSAAFCSLEWTATCPL